MYTSLEQATPSIVLAARDVTKGIDLADVVTTIDGQKAAERLDGRPILVDPGPHTFKFTAPSYLPEERQVLIRTGEKYRPVSVNLSPVLAATPSQAAPPSPLAPAASPLPAPASRGVPLASYIVGGVGVAALGAGVVLRLVGGNDFDHLQSTCKPGCTSSQVDPVKLKYQLSDVAFGVGAAALVGAVVIYAVAPRHSEPAMSLLFTPNPSGFAAGVQRSF